ncbi:hypothetical protein C900_05834 [Fulvivirga imtechensis AK7]|uniref:Tetratricopeptide repeat protein 21A/21B N-terminal ARM repeat domain-containing protein n=2 Tax=Fulvivirga TaxID=396811 RepID=L8JIX0_9BACT|nr:hypothetical protein C900_05834 [Fulvivirga imtechensis AK7]
MMAFSGCVEHSKDALHNADINVKAASVLEYLREVSEKEPRNHVVHYQLANVHFDEEQYRQAQINISKAIEFQEDNAEYYFLSGKIYQKLEEPEEAVKALLLAENLGKKNQELYYIIAEEYQRLKEPAKARKAIDQLTDMDNSAEAYTLKGNIMISLGDTVQAMENYQRAVKLDKTYPDAHIALADIHISRKNEQEAHKFVNTLLQLEPDNLGFLERKGELLMRSGELDSAKAIFSRIADERQHYLDYYQLSNVYYLQRAYDSAQYMAKKAFELNKDFLEAQILVARSLDKKRRYQEAIEVYQAILATDSTYNLAITELDNLQRKVAYLWRLEQERKEMDSTRNNPPPAVQKKEIIDNQK